MASNFYAPIRRAWTRTASSTSPSSIGPTASITSTGSRGPGRPPSNGSTTPTATSRSRSTSRGTRDRLLQLVELRVGYATAEDGLTFDRTALDFVLVAPALAFDALGHAHIARRNAYLTDETGAWATTLANGITGAMPDIEVTPSQVRVCVGPEQDLAVRIGNLTYLRHGRPDGIDQDCDGTTW